MTNPTGGHSVSLLDAYLDGTMIEEERVRFQRRLVDDPQLRGAYEQQLAIDVHHLPVVIPCGIHP